MSIETKIKEIIEINSAELAAQVGLVAMAAAATIGSMPDHVDSKRLILAPQTALVKPANNEDNNPIRREREDTAPHLISYNTFQRTPGRSGKA